MCTAPAFHGPLLRLREPFQQGCHPSYGTVCPPCREALSEVGAGSLKSLLHSSSRPLLPLKSCGPSLQHQCTDPHSNADDSACPGKTGGPHIWVRKRKYMSILKGVNHSANANARKEGGQAQHPNYPIFRDKSGNLLANTGGGWIWMIPPSICP